MSRLFFYKIIMSTNGFICSFPLCLGSVRLVVATPFQQERKDDLLKSLPDIHGLIVDSVLDSVLFDVGGLPVHHLPIGACHLGRLHFEVPSAFQINEFCGSVGIVEIHLLAVVKDVE